MNRQPDPALDRAGQRAGMGGDASGQAWSMTSSTSQVPQLPLDGGATIPQLGFGVFQVPPGGAARGAGRALDAGYRHTDPAAAYATRPGSARPSAPPAWIAGRSS